MRLRLPLILAATTLVVVLLGSTSLGQAATNGLARARNANAVNANSPSPTPTPIVTPPATIVTVTAGRPSPFRFRLSSRIVANGSVTFKVKNPPSSMLPYNFEVCSTPLAASAIGEPAADLPNSCAGLVTPVLRPGDRAILTIDFASSGPTST